jgi:tripartite-type tricarboxylate transporter receptor subunit TctC
MLNTLLMKTTKRCRAFLLALLSVVSSGQQALAQTQEYPTRPVKIVVPFAAGGPADNYARFMGQQLQAALGQNFIVENKPGAGSIIGTDFVAKAAADGYTLLMMSNAQTVNESLVTKKPYALLKDFVGIAPINYSDLLLVVHPRVAAKNLSELIALAKAQPGKLNYASSGTGTPYHMAGELLKAMAGIDITHVPYKGSSGARTDLLGGQVDFMFDAVTTMTDYARAGTVRGLATTGAIRSDILPNVPTMSEAGVTGYESTIWLGLMAPKGTPVAIINQLNAAVTAIVTRPEIKKQWAEKGAMPLSMSPLEFQIYLERDVIKWAKIVKLSGAKAD